MFIVFIRQACNCVGYIKPNCIIPEIFLIVNFSTVENSLCLC